MATGFYSHADCLLHDMGQWHPECPARLQAIEDQLIASHIDALIERESPPLANEAALLRVHTQAHVDYIRSRSPVEGLAEIDPDTSMNPHTLQAALRAAGAAVAATDAVIEGHFDNAFCSVRPPGHHAEPARAMGFCFFNNVAIAARHALEVHGLQRVAIIDFDVHHGNGTEAAFSGDSRVLMCSFFQHPFYPFTGADNQAPNMCNVPMPARSKGMAVREAVDLLWLPRLNEFKPEMLFISECFDAHREDDLGNMGLVEDDYVWITDQIRDIAKRYAGGLIVSCLWRAAITCRRSGAAWSLTCARWPASEREPRSRCRDALIEHTERANGRSERNQQTERAMNADAQNASLVTTETDAYGIPGVVRLTMNRPDGFNTLSEGCSTRCKPP
ncbi:MAG: Deacetylases, including yeast histone deacetylase and acetoin utilization protein [uncultured Paraburkholderia sp.]|nr:MAG: Deacetylases, including yeast histone deacetylase and acetoin utilization protein [uncultured Paraburkholderia sp.]